MNMAPSIRRCGPRNLATAYTLQCLTFHQALDRATRDTDENLFVLFIAPFSQELEPPQIPGRFTVAQRWSLK